MMEKPDGTIKTHLHRARKTLKAQLTAVMNKNIKITEVVHLVKEELEKLLDRSHKFRRISIKSLKMLKRMKRIFPGSMKNRKKEL